MRKAERANKNPMSGGVIVTKFEQIGVNIQHEARSKEDAVKRFQSSCNICCVRGMRVDCDCCSIKVAHDMTVACFSSQEEEYKRGMEQLLNPPVRCLQ